MESFQPSEVELDQQVADSGMTLIEVVVSFVVLAIVAVLLAGALTQLILLNERSAVLGSLSQVAASEVSRIQSEVDTCAELSSLVATPRLGQIYVSGQPTNVTVLSQPLGWSTCGTVVTGSYALRVTTRTTEQVSFQVETVVVIK